MMDQARNDYAIDGSWCWAVQGSSDKGVIQGRLWRASVGWSGRAIISDWQIIIVFRRLAALPTHGSNTGTEIARSNALKRKGEGKGKLTKVRQSINTYFYPVKIAQAALGVIPNDLTSRQGTRNKKMARGMAFVAKDEA